MTCRSLPVLLALLTIIGCSSTSTKVQENALPQAAESKAEAEYGTAYKNLMLEFKDNAVKANEELDGAEAKGLPKDRKAKLAVIIQLMERNVGRAKYTLAKARKMKAPPRFTDFHSSVMRFLEDMVAGDVKYLQAAKDRRRDTAKILEENEQSMSENYEKMKLEGQKLGIPMVNPFSD